MKALDKVFDTQVITGIIGDKFHFCWRSREKFLIYEEGRENRQEKDGIKKVTIVTEENPTEFIKVKDEWNIERYQVIKIIWFNWFLLKI